MNLLDALLAVIIAASIIAGFRAGFARVGIGFVAAVSGLLAGFWFYGIPAAAIHRYVSSRTFSDLLGFFVVFFAFVIVGALIGKLLTRLFRWTGLTWVDRVLGGGFGLARGGLMVVAFVAVLLAFTPRPAPAWMVDSKLLPYAVDASNMCAALAPRAVKEAFRDSMREIRKAWEEQMHPQPHRKEKPEKEPEKEKDLKKVENG